VTGPAVTITGVVKRFGPVTALDGVSLAVDAGTVFGLLGPNGSGKTTLVRILTTILAPDRGQAAVLGYDVTRQPAQVRLKVGLAGQAAAVDGNLTGAENLTLIGRLAHVPRRAIPARVGELLDAFGLTGAAHRPARTYSGGMRRRLDIAASLVHRPPVLFLDEPTTGLDPHSRTALWGMVRDLVSDGTTVVLTTQYLEEADHLAGQLAVLDHGTVIAEGTPAQLKARLGATVIELGFPDGQRAARARDSLAARASAPGPMRAEQSGPALRLTTADGSRLLASLLPELNAGGLAPDTIVVREPSLDDVFLALTGRPAGTPGPGPGPAAGARDPAGDPGPQQPSTSASTR
jgi:daunorubicin resistance ABC transporter ATP-binding subunit